MNRASREKSNKIIESIFIKFLFNFSAVRPIKRRDKEFCNSITTARSLFPTEPNTIDFQSVIVFLIFLLEALFADGTP